MNRNCVLCGEIVEEIFLNKLNGTIVKIINEGENEFFFACNSCQRKFGDKLKEEVKNAR